MPNEVCFHCGLDILGQTRFTAVVDGQDRPMCCPGCKAVTETIVQGGLDNYYTFRSSQANTATSGIISPDKAQTFRLYDQDTLQQGFVTQDEHDLSQAQFAIEGITCAACVWLLEHHIRGLKSVRDVKVNLTTHRARVTWDKAELPLSELMASIYRIGYQAHPYTPDKEEQLRNKERKLAIMRLGVAGIGMMQVMMMAVALYSGALQGIEDQYVNFLRWGSMAISTPVVLFSAMPFFVATIRDLKTRHLTMDVPVSIAIGGAYAASVWATVQQTGEVYFDSVTMFTFFLLIGRFLEMQARHRTGLAGNAIANLLPASARKLAEDGLTETLVPALELKPDDLISVHIGDVIPADGIVVSGHTQVDESALTGEYLPITKTPDDVVTGGTLNVEQPFTMRVTAATDQSKVSAIMQLLERAQSEKPRLAEFADKVASYFVAAVLLVGATVFGVWWLLEPKDALWITLSVLVVTCPCALSLATPTALTAATGALRAAGLLVTRGHVLNTLASVTHVVFDKTGTLTQGELAVKDVRLLANLSEDKATALAASLEAHSQHPIAHAFAHVIDKPNALDISITTSQGIQGQVDGQLYRLGKPQYAMAVCRSQKIQPLPPNAVGQWLLLSSEDGPVAWFLLDDQLRSEALATVKGLRRLGIETVMLTGDSSGAADEAAKALSIHQYQKDASPEQKLSYIQKLQANGDSIIMVGDGVNDIPSLAAADTSIAMGGATDLAKTSADSVLLNSQLTTLLSAILLARKSKSVISQNLGWALAYNLLALPLAAMGYIPPYLAAIGMSASSLVVVGNAIRLTRVPKI